MARHRSVAGLILKKFCQRSILQSRHRIFAQLRLERAIERMQWCLTLQR